MWCAGAASDLADGWCVGGAGDVARDCAGPGAPVWPTRVALGATGLSVHCAWHPFAGAADIRLLPVAADRHRPATVLGCRGGDVAVLRRLHERSVPHWHRIAA